MSNYKLDDLNIKFIKIIQFKTIEQFMSILIENIKKKYLILNSPYKNAITTTWKIFPDSKEKKQTFSLVSSFDSHKTISLLFYSDFKTSEKFLKEIEKAIQGEKPNEDKQSFYLKLFYEEHWLIENMYFLSNEYKDDKNKIKKFLQLYNKAIENREKKGRKKNITYFF